MAFYRKNIGGLHQVTRIILSLAVVVAAVVYLSGIAAWLAIAGAIAFALTGVVGYCPMCAAGGIGRRDLS